METVQSILAAKGNDVVSVGTETTVVQALELMAEKNIGAIMVLDASGEPVGIFSERDFARKIILKGRDCDHTKVKEIMTSKIIYAENKTSIAECMSLMTTHHFRHLPVKEKGKLIGVVSIGDVVKALIQHQERVISEQAFEIGQHERRSPGAV
ncbi:MAG: CBS domain-containing protein [Spirochaetes bacterium]|nr:CBS domain-containing protein [Spirochaetota bacterium]MBU1080245.1 CBS domain-containing protein [Spirochaetota bacterium]